MSALLIVGAEADCLALTLKVTARIKRNFVDLLIFDFSFGFHEYHYPKSKISD
jgi:hypothetical protein